MVLEPGEPAHVQPRVGVRDDLADRAPLAAPAADIEQAKARHRRVVPADELVAKQLVTRADREHHGAALGSRVQAAIGEQAPDG